MEQGGEKWSGVDVEAIHPKSEKVGGHCFLAHKNLAEKGVNRDIKFRDKSA